VTFISAFVVNHSPATNVNIPSFPSLRGVRDEAIWPMDAVDVRMPDGFAAFEMTDKK